MIRAFEVDELSHLDDIRRLAFAPVFASFRQIVGPSIAETAFAAAEAEQAELLKTICDPNTPDQVFIGVRDGVIAGFVSLTLNHETKVGEIGLNAVRPDCSGQGVGTALYEFALQEMRKAGMAIATVGTGGDESHTAARRAYEKVGFRAEAAIPSLWMYRKL
ncbi:MAG: GNAT family N-acetyltransferase [Hyphomicrobiales bacterium]|nr:GNAT family N-acetyltransferase [Hyphomicrobiales bacterium]